MNQQRVVTIYAESTPNPASMKFVINSFLLEEGSVEYTSKEQAKECPLALQLFTFFCSPVKQKSDLQFAQTPGLGSSLV